MKFYKKKRFTFILFSRLITKQFLNELFHEIFDQIFRKTSRNTWTEIILRTYYERIQKNIYRNSKSLYSKSLLNYFYKNSFLHTWITSVFICQELFRMKKSYVEQNDQLICKTSQFAKFLSKSPLYSCNKIYEYR